MTKYFFALSMSMMLFSSSVLAEVTGFAGIDHIASTDPTVRYLPGYKVVPYESNSGFIRLTNSYQLSSKSDINVAISSDYEDHLKIDKLEFDTKLDYNFAKNAGVRLGILPYRVSWCRKYDADSIWIQEPDVFCKQKTLREMSASGAGAQYYRSAYTDNHIIDTQLSIYKPSLYGPETMAIYVPEGKTQYHHKVGVSINVLNVKTATQYRFGFLKTWQYVKSTDDRLYHYDAVFLGAEQAYTNWRFRGTYSGYFGTQTNYPDQAKFVATSRVLETEYSTGRNHFGFAVSKYISHTDYVGYNFPQELIVTSMTASYRRKLNNRESVLIQAGNSNESLQLPTIDAPDIRLKQGKFVMMRYLITF